MHIDLLLPALQGVPCAPEPSLCCAPRSHLNTSCTFAHPGHLTPRQPALQPSPAQPAPQCAAQPSPAHLLREDGEPEGNEVQPALRAAALSGLQQLGRDRGHCGAQQRLQPAKGAAHVGAHLEELQGGALLRLALACGGGVGVRL